MTREWDWKFGNSLVPLPNSRWRKILLINKNWAPLPDHHVKSLFNVRQIEEEVWNVILLLLVIPNFTHFIPFFFLLLSPASLEYSSNNFTVHTLLRPSKRQCFEIYTGKGAKLKVFFCSRCHVEFSINFSLLVAMIKKCRMNRNCAPWITLSLFSFSCVCSKFLQLHEHLWQINFSNSSDLSRRIFHVFLATFGRWKNFFSCSSWNFYTRESKTRLKISHSFSHCFHITSSIQLFTFHRINLLFFSGSLKHKFDIKMFQDVPRYFVWWKKLRENEKTCNKILWVIFFFDNIFPCVWSRWSNEAHTKVSHFLSHFNYKLNLMIRDRGSWWWWCRGNGKFGWVKLVVCWVESK